MVPDNFLYYGDNLGVLRDDLAEESVDLIYLDPPFNSNATYNVLFRAPTGEQSKAQMQAFDDTWHWNDQSEAAFDDVLKSGNTDAANVLRALRSFLEDNDMMAYLANMAVRLLELHRVLKKTGSLYLHCDPTASHYLKIVMDSIFGRKKLVNEIIWHYRKWPTGKYSFQRNHDIILLYEKGEPENRTFNQLFMERAASTVKRFGSKKIISGHARSGDRVPSQMSEEDSEGVRQDDVWNIGRVPPIKQLFPTQKPDALLDRIIQASSREDNVVLDPFCGCGTTILSATRLHRQWIGIDVTHLAIGLIERRLKQAFPDTKFRVEGTPKDFAGAEDLARRDKHQFQIWAVTLINAVPYKGGKKGADTGIDGYYYCKPDGKTSEAGIVSVKGGENLHRNMVSDLVGVMRRERAPLAVLISLREPTEPMIREAAAAGVFNTPFGRFPKVQIVPVENLLEGKFPKLPPQEIGGGFKVTSEQAHREPDLALQAPPVRKVAEPEGEGYPKAPPKPKKRPKPW